MSAKAALCGANASPKVVGTTTGEYLTRRQVPQRYPISMHTLALASQGKGPRFFKPTDKCLYLAEDIEAWIETAAILPRADDTKKVKTLRPAPANAGNGRGKARPAPFPPTHPKNGRKSLPPHRTRGCVARTVNVSMVLHHPAVQHARQKNGGRLTLLQGT